MPPITAILTLLAIAPANAGNLPRPAFYLPLDGSTTAAIAGGSAAPRQVVPAESIFALVDRESRKFWPGRVGQCYDPGNQPLLFSGNGNLPPREGAIGFWLQPQFRGDSETFCIFVSALPWGMFYKYQGVSPLTFATARPGGGWYYDCSTNDIRGWRPGEWHHVAACWSRKGNFRRLYLDGKLRAIAPFPYCEESRDARLVLGGGSGEFAANLAHARMDEVAIWDRPLDDAAVRRLFELGEQGKPIVLLPGGPAEDRTQAMKLVVPSAAGGPAGGGAPGSRLFERPLSASQPTPTRRRLSLDGQWRFLPLERPIKELPETGWGFATVPGIWTAQGMVRGADGREIAGQWAGRPLTDFSVACYLRTFSLPAAWQGRPVFLEVGGVDGLAELFLNDHPLAALPAWEPAAYDVGSLLRFGEENRLAIRLRARQGGASPGIYGSVSLAMMPASFVSDIAVQPSVERGEIRFSTDVWHAGDAEAERIEFEIAREPDRTTVEKRFAYKFQATQRKPAVGELSAQVQRVDCTFPWKDARQWTYDDPALYSVRARLYAGGSLLDESPPLRFGFREFLSRGGQLLLNGVPTHLRGHQVSVRAGSQLDRVKELKDAGMNCFECLGPVDGDWYRGSPYRLGEYEELLDYADRNGMLAIPVLPDLLQIRQRIFEPPVAELYRRRLEKHIRRFGNHPSICMWYMHFNLAGYPWYLAPSNLDGSYKPGNPEFQQRERFAREAQRMAGAIDPRPLFHHACGNFGDMYTMNCYLGPNCPLAEREEWPLRWSQQRPFPLIACEHGMMLIPYWFRPRQFPLEAVYSGEPIFDEIAAIYLGRRAYRTLTPQVFDLYRLGSGSCDTRLRDLTRQHPGYQEVKSLFARHSLRSWRTFGVSGILFNALQWDFRDGAGNPSPVMQGMARYFGPTDLYIAGPEGDWLAKDHAFFSGETVRKQAVLLNDLTHDLACKLAWRLEDTGGKSLASGKIDAVARAGVPSMYPIAFTAPPVAHRAALRLVLEGEPEDPHFRADKLAIEVFPPRRPPTTSTWRPPAGRILVYDPGGETTAMLARAGIRVEALSSRSDLPSAALLVVGRRAYGAAFLDLARKLRVERAVAGGLNLLVLEQTAPEVLGLRLHEQSQRQAFISSPGSPLLAGLTAEDFSNLRGESDLIAPYPAAPPETENRWPARCYKWGNRGVTATYVYTKPHYAALAPVLESGFDLTDSPLLEGRAGRGRIVLCQVDVTSRYGSDPVSTRIIDNALRSLAVRDGEPGTPRSSAVNCSCVGESARALAERFHLDPVAVEAESPVILIGAEPLSDDRARSILAVAGRGATVLLLPGSSLADAAGLKLARRKLFLGRPDDNPLLAGISDADLYLKAWIELPVAVGGDGWQVLAQPGLIARKAVGRGQLIACMLDPLHCGPRGRIKTLRVWNLLLTNLQLRRKTDEEFFQPKASLYEANDWEAMPPYVNW